MNEYLKNLNRIEVVVTMACTGKCKHCSEGDHIGCTEYVDGDAVATAVKEICANYRIESLMTFGGEPLLYPEEVCKIHSAARDAGIASRSIITNGFFSKDNERIKDVVHKLTESGVNSILLSVDAFHQETIPLEPVIYFAKCAMDEGLAIKVHPAWLVSETDDNPYNVKTREILSKFTELGIDVSSGNVIFPSGNALKYLGEYFDTDTGYVNPYEDDPRDIRAISFNPNGDVLDGNIMEMEIMEILEGYNPDFCYIKKSTL